MNVTVNITCSSPEELSRLARVFAILSTNPDASITPAVEPQRVLHSWDRQQVANPAPEEAKQPEPAADPVPEGEPKKRRGRPRKNPEGTAETPKDAAPVEDPKPESTPEAPPEPQLDVTHERLKEALNETLSLVGEDPCLALFERWKIHKLSSVPPHRRAQFLAELVELRRIAQ